LAAGLASGAVALWLLLRGIDFLFKAARRVDG
jgi:hypothetical protein